MALRREVWSRRSVVLLLRLQPCVADHCSWKGSGLNWEPRSRAVEQVHLRCTKGFLEWMYPARALCVILEPNLLSTQHTTVCIKPFHNFQGANLYVEQGEQLHLLVSEAEQSWWHQVSCFSSHTPQRVALFLQATPQRDIGRKSASFQYELLSNWSAVGPDFHKIGPCGRVMELAFHTARVYVFPFLISSNSLDPIIMCRPCDNMELLMAICSSDFVVRGTIENISHDSENHMSWVDVSVDRVYRQKNQIFQPEETTGEWQGLIKTLLQCKVKKGAGDFLFIGNEHFGEGWLGCAPRFKDFCAIKLLERGEQILVNFSLTDACQPWSR